MSYRVKDKIIESLIRGDTSTATAEELKYLACEVLSARCSLEQRAADISKEIEKAVQEERKKIASYISTAYSSSATINMIANDIARGEHAKIVVLS